MLTDKTQKEKDTTQEPEDVTPKETEPSPKPVEPAPKETPKTHTQEEVDRLVQLTKMESGRERKAIEVERDSLKKQLQAKETEITDIADEREKLQTQIDELSSDDPKKFDLVKKDRDLRERERQLKNERLALDEDKQKNAEKVSKAEKFEMEVLILEIVEDYENGDLDKLKSLCEILEAKSEEQIRRVAETLWTKKAAEPSKPATPPVKPYSGVTDGGVEDSSNLSPREKIDKGIEIAKQKKK
uniref:Scaffolding protein n=1 Tax=viral metagenome TaxID=1070528 RepID=A0A6H1ZJL8_9ZZZZ